MTAALRRFGELLVGISLLVGASSVALGFALGSSLGRAVSVGFYIAGVVVLLGGFFVGSRGPLRARGGDGSLLLRPRAVRRATPAEQEEAINMSAVLVVLGLVLIVIGILADPRQSLF
ncbi:MAG: hypothetical protein ABR583_06585 [Gaiellaceae bacterium]